MARERHTVKELETVLKDAEEKGWRVERHKRYWKLYCPNGCKCFKTVKCTPSDPKYLMNLLGQLRRGTCWRKS